MDVTLEERNTMRCLNVKLVTYGAAATATSPLPLRRRRGGATDCSRPCILYTRRIKYCGGDMYKSVYTNIKAITICGLFLTSSDSTLFDAQASHRAVSTNMACRFHYHVVAKTQRPCGIFLIQNIMYNVWIVSAYYLHVKQFTCLTNFL